MLLKIYLYYNLNLLQTIKHLPSCLPSVPMPMPIPMPMPVPISIPIPMPIIKAPRYSKGTVAWALSN